MMSVEKLLVNFNLAIHFEIANPSNLIPYQIFWLYSISVHVYVYR